MAEDPRSNEHEYNGTEPPKAKPEERQKGVSGYFKNKKKVYPGLNEAGDYNTPVKKEE